MKLMLAVGAALALAIALPATASAKTLIASGSVAAQPVFQALFNGYHTANPKIAFVYTADGGNAGVKDVQAGRSQFAGQARPPLPSDAGTTYIKMYLDGLCVDVNPANSLSNIQIPILRDIYLANRTSWSQVPGSNQTSTIHPFGRDSNGGTYTFFSQAVLNNKPPSSKVTPLGSDTLIMNQVKADPANIGYAGLAYQGKGIKKLKVGGVACKPSTIKPLRYPLSRFIWLVLPTAHPNLQVEKFADWARTAHKAGKIITQAGGVPVFNKGFR